MAIQNDPRLYSGGSVVFNQRPHVQLYAQLMQQKQARENAFDEYTRNLNKSVNSAGVRNQDRQVFDEKLADWQNFGMKNRDAIRSRKGGADIEFMKKYQDIQNIISRSKSTEEGKKPLVPLLLDPDKRDRLGNEVVDAIHAQDQPLYVKDQSGKWVDNPDFKPLDYGSLAFNPKPFEQDKYFKQFEDVKRTELPPIVTSDPKTMTQTETKKSVYDQEAKDLIATRAVTDLAQNQSFRQVVKNLKPEDYNDFFKEIFGHDIQNEGDLAAAYTLKGLQQNVTTSKVNPDTYERQKAMAGITDQYARRRLAIQNAYAKDRIDYRQAKTQKEKDGVLEGYISRMYEEGKDTKGAVAIKGKFVHSKDINVPKKYIDLYTLDKGSTVEQIPRFVMTRDKKYVVPVYPGKKSDYKPPIPMETFRNEIGQLLLSKKDAAAEMDEIDFSDEVDDQPTVSGAPSAPQDDGYTREELKAAGWKDSQIDQAAKAGKIKLK